MGALRSPPPSKRSRLIAALVASLVAHAILLPLLASGAAFTGVHPPQKRSAVSLVATPRSQVQRAPAFPGQRPSAGTSPLEPRLPAALPQLAEVKPKEPEKIEGQVVAIGQPKDERAPEKPTKYLSEKDSRAEKESRAKETSPFFKNALSKVQKEGADKAKKPQAVATPTLPQKSAGEQGERGGQKLLAQKSVEAELPAKKRVDRLRIGEAAEGTLRNRDATDATPGIGRKLAMARPATKEGAPGIQGEGGPGKPGLPGDAGAQKPLNLSLNDIGGAVGPVAGGPMNDDLRSLAEGDETLLNSRSFRYAGFLNRVKETVGRIWVTDVQDAAGRRDPNGQMYSYKDRRTVVEFTLDAAGELRDVRVQSSCGVPYLDQVAVDAFRKAERFPNPPPGLMNVDGTMRLPFAFTLLAAQGGIKMSIGPAYLPGSPAQRGF